MTLAERQAIIDRIINTQPDDFVQAVRDAGLDPAVDLAFIDLSGADLRMAGYSY